MTPSISPEQPIEFSEQRAALLAAGYQEHKASLSMMLVNVLAIAIMVPVVVGLSMLMSRLHPPSGETFQFRLSLWLVLLLFASIPVHEFLHGFTWQFFCKRGWKSIKFGIHMLNPYCHCKEALAMKGYALGALVPMLVLGVVPILVGLITGSYSWFGFGAFNLAAAGGDASLIAILWRYRRCLILDHPKEAGFLAYCKPE